MPDDAGPANATVALRPAEAGARARVVRLCGDGGFGHSRAGLETLRRLVPPVLHNGIPGHQKRAEEARFGEHTDAEGFAAVDDAIAERACGVEGVRVESGAALDARRPAPLDQPTDPGAKPPISAFPGRHSEPF